jgi:SAM-dependent methyltransferase
MFVDSSAGEAQRHRGCMVACGQDAIDASSRVLPIVFGLFDVHSVLDVGCGTGAWLATAGQLGAERLTGVDAGWAKDWLEDTDMLDRAGFTFVPHDLRSARRIDATDRHDLVISLEVAQHLPEWRAPSFVEELCTASTKVLFSSAVPRQFPPLDSIMINNQWQSYWAALFRSHDFLPCDVIRPLVWHDEGIADYYRQNTLLYVHRSEHDTVLQAAAARLEKPLMLLDAVHPTCWMRRSREGLDPPGFRESLRVARAAFVRAIRKRLRALGPPRS